MVRNLEKFLSKSVVKCNRKWFFKIYKIIGFYGWRWIYLIGMEKYGEIF